MTPSNGPPRSIVRASPCRTRATLPLGPDRREGLDPVERVERVAEQEPPRRVDGPALAAVLEAPVRLELRGAREVEVEVGRPPRRARRARQHDPEHVRRADLLDERAEVEQLLGRRRGVPGAHVARRLTRVAAARLERLGLRVGPEQVAPQRVEVVGARLDAHEQRVEAGDVHARRVVARLERLHERRPGACERIEHTATRGHVPVEQHLDELRDELAEVRVEPVHVLRALALGQRGSPTRTARGRAPGRALPGSRPWERQFDAPGAGPTRDVERPQPRDRAAGSADAWRRATPCRLPRAGSRCRATPWPG